MVLLLMSNSRERSDIKKKRSLIRLIPCDKVNVNVKVNFWLEIGQQKNDKVAFGASPNIGITGGVIDIRVKLGYQLILIRIVI